MENHYQTLGVNSSATAAEIRRAYRVLARRYHPDLNPGKDSENKFKAISTAYSTLSDPATRAIYDTKLEEVLRGKMKGGFANYERVQREYSRAKKKFDEERQRRTPGDTAAQSGAARRESGPASRPGPAKLWDGLAAAKVKLGGAWRFLMRPVSWTGKKTSGTDPQQVTKISIIEVSITISDAISGVKKSVEIAEPEGTRKVSVNIPPGVRTGSVVRLRSKANEKEDLVLIMRVAQHPFLQLRQKGLVAEIPISVKEAVQGASITVPTLEDQMVIKVSPNTQSGTEIRLKERGVRHKDGTRGDLFLRLMIHIPGSAGAVGLEEKTGELEQYYESPVRHNFPKNLLEVT